MVFQIFDFSYENGDPKKHGHLKDVCAWSNTCTPCGFGKKCKTKYLRSKKKEKVQSRVTQQ
jgi:hypothetical protein